MSRKGVTGLSSLNKPVARTIVMGSCCFSILTGRVLRFSYWRRSFLACAFSLCCDRRESEVVSEQISIDSNKLFSPLLISRLVS